MLMSYAKPVSQRDLGSESNVTSFELAQRPSARKHMSGYFGTDLQKELQRRTFENRQKIAVTPGLYNAGRFIGTDDPDKLGWAALRTLLKEQHGVLGFRLITREQAAVYFPLAEAEGCRVDQWDVFMGDAAIVRPKVEVILDAGLPDGVVLAGALTSPWGDETVCVQRFAADNGVAPLPGSLLVGGSSQATVVLTDLDRTPAAVANTYFAHNSHSPHFRNAWVGMVAVEATLRGRGLGRYASAMAIHKAITEMGATRVHELVGAGNESSRRMALACGLSPHSELLVGVAVPGEVSRFSR
jgi:hypothetical protein